MGEDITAGLGLPPVGGASGFVVRPGELDGGFEDLGGPLSTPRFVPVVDVSRVTRGRVRLGGLRQELDWKPGVRLSFDPCEMDGAVVVSPSVARSGGVPLGDDWRLAIPAKVRRGLLLETSGSQVVAVTVEGSRRSLVLLGPIGVAAVMGGLHEQARPF